MFLACLRPCALVNCLYIYIRARVYSLLKTLLSPYLRDFAPAKLSHSLNLHKIKPLLNRINKGNSKKINQK